MPLNFLKFFRPGYFFDLRPGFLSHEAITVLWTVFGIMFFLGLIVKIIQKSKKREHFLDKLFNRYVGLLITMSLLGAIWIWLRSELVMVLSARFWLAVWFIGLVIWLASILKYQFKTVPKAAEQLEQKRLFNKYLPGKKK